MINILWMFDLTDSSSKFENAIHETHNYLWTDLFLADFNSDLLLDFLALNGDLID